mmetsp:Transcript_44277/g.51177  ORF Transcript_44277/g.51177 Transcript_44277/m.51177 type:complete len:257 (+) Transcript_44277:49-819(+)|eukprot:CAMPEP_0176462720 /NCGR_PEP_ID=MMETSP0127-20121128/35448_1 /TAXON_ID=938130 /ORGANISM="Platyophrya macrostoma, Strain WH" /LENGTH=256 /DNA_ID=CAMNT_0017854717 /DNA_START=48 /DNA_END=818 /DNA_ORIENTATION=-
MRLPLVATGLSSCTTRQFSHQMASSCGIRCAPRCTGLLLAASGGLNPATGSATALTLSRRGLTINGRVTNEDRRWWLVHLECSPDVTPGTFIAWLDGCGTHTTKKLIERNVWTIAQVAELDSDQVDELKYKEGCPKMDIVWEHARTIVGPLKQREVSGGVESELQDKIMQLRKKRELERRREEILAERVQTSENRESAMEKLRAQIAAKKAELLKKQQQAQSAAHSSSSSDSERHDSSTGVGDVMKGMSGQQTPRA